VAALRPKTIGLTRDRAAGSIPYLVTAAHTAASCEQRFHGGRPGERRQRPPHRRGPRLGRRKRGSAPASTSASPRARIMW